MSVENNRKMDWGEYILRLVHLICNTTLSIIGCACIYHGVLIMKSSDEHSLRYFLKFTGVAVLIILGGIYLLISFLGSCVVIRESFSIIITYLGFLYFLLIMQIILMYRYIVEKSQVINALKNDIETAWKNNEMFGRTFDDLQRKLKCCGSKGFEDYPTFMKLPESCCKGSCEYFENIYDGCGNKYVEEEFKNPLHIFENIGLFLILFNMFVIIVASSMAGKERSQSEGSEERIETKQPLYVKV